MVSTIVNYQLVTKDITRSLQRTADKPDVSRDTKYYLTHIGDVKSIDDFIGDYRLFSYAMKAHGLSDMTYAKAFLRKVLTEGISDSSSFANKLVDTRYRDFAAAFNFASLGEQATNTTGATTGTAEKYIRQSLEEDAGKDNEGVRLALYFERKAPTIKTAYQILSDKALLQVVQTAFGISPLTAMADIDKQAAMIEAKVDFADFQDPAKLRTFLQRFSVMWDVENNQATSAAAPQILTGQPIEFGLSARILTSLQGLKLGR
ncbi:DUF1217 domain-containing protein [Rhodopseudomonas sp. NSM]|uniref:DUF1217 domain-containing protein n=1 Tax=Rhodopseudomonas sp. NSM TaxID=3457630 RepID=UPI004036FCF9